MRTSAFMSLVAAVMTFAAISEPSVAGALSGVITDSATGNVISGALVRTEGEPTYQAASDSSGNYTITLSATTCNVLVSAAGRIPQRATIVTTGTALSNFALRAASSTGSRVYLPAPLDWGEPGATTAPGDSYPICFSDMAATTASDAPKIACWNEIIKPDESFTLSGCRFTLRTGADTGTDTTVWIWARTSNTGGVLRQARLWHVTENTLTATVPDDVPYGMYLVWVENASGVSLPICINKTTAAWVGPLGSTVQAGNKKRIFGRNISQNRDSATSFVYIQPAGGGSLISCPVGTVNPYMVEFTVPADTPNGSYNVFVHNGHGGVYGWSDGLPLTVANDFVRGTGVYTMAAPSGTDDTASIQAAINAVSAWTNGGTVQFQTGTYKLYNTVTLKSNVRLVGSGMDSTKIECRLNAPGPYGTFFYMQGNNVSMESMEIRSCIPQPANSYSGSYMVSVSSTPDSFKLLGCRICYEAGVSTWQGGAPGCRTEVANCEIYFGWNAGTYDGWMHDCNLYGGPYNACEAPFTPTNRTVFENCQIMTQNWPYDPAKSHPWNYADNLSYSAYQYQPWAKRVSLYNNYGFFSQDTYSANLTGTNIAVEDNRGEEFLAHPYRGQWCGQVASNNGLTITVNPSAFTDQTFTTNYDGSLVYCGGNMRSNLPGDWVPTDIDWVTIVGGRGMGQTNKVVSHSNTNNTVTVQNPWRIQPDSTSIISITPLYVDHVVYNCNISAFPAGYNQDQTACCSAQIANGFQFFMENCKSYRTCGASGILGFTGGPSYWCMVRDQEAHDCYNCGYGIVAAGPTNSFGAFCLGDSFHDCSTNVFGTIYYFGNANPAMGLSGEGIVCENFASPNPGDASKGVMLGYELVGATSSDAFLNGFTLYRNGNITSAFDQIDPPALQPVYITRTDGRQFLINNTYNGAPQTYFLASGLSAYSLPAPEYRLARFSGYTGSILQPQIIPIANAGIAAMTWTVTPNDSWISASIQSNSTLAAESTLGRLAIAIDTSGMTAGTHWGSITISNGMSPVKVGVRVDLLSGPPSNQPPMASFTAAPTAGAAPLAVSFNAGASYDSDGSIQSYYWDFGDGTHGTGVTTNHTYTSGSTYTPVLTVTDDSGSTGSSWTNVAVSPTLTGVTLTGSPNGVIGANTPVTLTAAASGGYLVQYKFLVNSGAGWATLGGGYQSSNTIVWTPPSSGYYQVKVWARNTGSTSVYDAVSGILSYPVGLLPSGAKLWLKADAGLSTSGTAVTSWADQSGSGNNVSQAIGNLQPSCVAGSMNGMPAVRFTGPGQMLQSLNLVLTGSTSFTSFAVLKYNQLPGGYQYIWWNGGDQPSSGYGVYLTPAAATRCSWTSYSAAPTYSTAATIGMCCTVTTRFTSTSGSGPNELWVNGDNSAGSKTKSGSNLSGGTFTLGNYGPSAGMGLYGDVGEVLIYNRALTDAERQGVESYLTSRWTAPTPTSIDRLKDVKLLPDGALVSITTPKVVTAASGIYSDGAIYVSESDRTCGMRVTGVATAALGDNLTLTGTTDTEPSGERVLRVTSSTVGANTPLGALGMTNKSFSVSGQLVTVWGKVIDVQPTYFTLDDGSGQPVKVETGGLMTPIGSLPSVGQYVSAEGPVGFMAGGATAVRVRSGADIQLY